ncbi:MAG: ATP-binding protein [Planctomycetota bacterium]
MTIPAACVDENPYDVLPLGVCQLDSALRVLLWNATLEAWTGIARSEVIGRPLTEFFPAVGHRPLRSRLASVFEDGVPLVFSAALHQSIIPIAVPDGSVMPHRTFIRRLDGDDARAIVVLEDLSQPMGQLEKLRVERRRLAESEASLQRRQAELRLTNDKLQEASERAEQACRSKSEFLANMSHEIRTPLTAILGFADILLSEPDAAMHRSSAETIQRNGEHLLAVVNDILDLSKIEAGRFQLSWADASPAAVVHEVASLLKVRADAKGLAIEVTTEPGVPDSIATDEVRLRQVLLNLVGNAVKFTESGRVAVTLRSVGAAGQPRIAFDVQDTGIGIAEADLQTIFQPFSQADTSAQRRFGGTGLGLAICGRLAGMLGGGIEVNSEVGVGSTFCLTLPVGKTTQSGVAPAAEPASAAPDTQPSDKPLGGRLLLVAEDGPDNQRLIEYHLTKAGAELCIVSDGEQATRAVLGRDPTAKPFDLILMDMQMPVMDGYQATAALRAGGHTGPVVALTAHAMEGDRQKALAAGCDDYATKPIDAPKLIATINAFVTQAAATDA